MARLIIRYPDNRIQEVEFKKPTYKIGAAEDNDLVLENDEVAPNQAEIETSGGNYFLVDVSGNETTTVNGKIIDRVNITYGDRINFGPVVGLFYPPQKKNVFGEKTKLVMYLGAGAVVLIVSFVLIYYFTTRQISTVVTERIGGDIPALQSVEKEPEPSPQPSIEPPAAEAEEAEDKAASAEAEQTGRASQKEGIFSKIKNIFSQKPQLELPQPDQSTIKNRTAIAVPQGIEKLFFRKIPVEVERPEKEPEEAQVEEKAEPEKPSEETTKPAAPEQPAPEEPQPTPQPSAQQPAQEEAPAMPEEEGVSEEGFFSRIIKPIKNLFFPGEELEEAAGAGEAPSAPATAPEEFPEPEAPAGERQQPEETLQQAPAGKPSPEHIKKVLDPLAYISSIDVPGLKGKELEEGPIYSEEELTEYKKTTVEEVQLSESENMNMDTVWRFPPGMGEAVPIIRTGVGLNVDGQKDLEMVYGSTAGRLAALKGSSGEQVLVQDTGKPFFGPVFLDADDDGRQDIVLLFENGDGVAYTQNLEQLWYYQGQSSIVASPLVSDLNQDGIPDMVFPIRNMDIQAIDGTTGFELWRFFDAQSETIF
ncbi:MAG: FHA domain-containing protein, partial [Spirochaetota bacterium]